MHPNQYSHTGKYTPLACAHTSTHTWQALTASVAARFTSIRKMYFLLNIILYYIHMYSQTRRFWLRTTAVYSYIASRHFNYGKGFSDILTLSCPLSPVVEYKGTPMLVSRFAPNSLALVLTLIHPHLYLPWHCVSPSGWVSPGTKGFTCLHLC